MLHILECVGLAKGQFGGWHILYICNIWYLFLNIYNLLTCYPYIYCTLQNTNEHFVVGFNIHDIHISYNKIRFK